MNDVRTGLVEKIYDIYRSRGFVKEDEILDTASDASLSILDINWLTETLLARGVIIRDDEPPRSSDDDEYDARKIDYDALFSKVVAFAPKLECFIEYVKSIQPAQRGEWVGLIPQARNGNKWAYNRLFEMNLRVVIKNAWYYAETYNVSLDDAIQEGCIGLMYAIDKFDQSEYNSFPGFVARPISGHIQRGTDFSYSPLFDFPALFKDGLYKIFELVENHSCHHCFCGDKCGCNNLATEVMSKLECSKDDAKDFLEFFAEYKPIDNNVEDDYFDQPFDSVSRAELKKIIHEILGELDNPREERVLRMRFGFEGIEPMCLEEIGVFFGMTRERVRQIEQKAIQKLRHPVRAQRLKSFIDDN